MNELQEVLNEMLDVDTLDLRELIDELDNQIHNPLKRENLTKTLRYADSYSLEYQINELKKLFWAFVSAKNALKSKF